MGIVYKLTFPNNKIYIGITRGTLRQRLHGHKYAAKNNRKSPLYNAWRVHGEPRAEVVAEVPNDRLAQVEIELISLHESYGPNGYNSTPGGDESPMLRPEIAAKVRALASTPERIAHTKLVHTGSKRSAETLKLFSDMRKGQGKGVPKSPEHRRKIAEANRGRTHTQETKEKLRAAALAQWAKVK